MNLRSFISNLKKYAQKIKSITFILLTISIIIIIPIIIYNGFEFPIKISTKAIENDTSGWLGFWGSFLGGIIGGFATLIGVKISLNKSEDEKKEERRPMLIPKRAEINILKSKERIEFSNIRNDNNQKEDYGLINLILFNASKELALQIEVGWIKPNLKSIRKSDLLEEDKIIYENVRTILSKEYECKGELNMLASLQEDEVMLTYSCQIYIRKLVESFIEHAKKNKKNNIEKLDIPLGRIEIEFFNIYRDKVINIYEVTAFIDINN